MFGKSLTLVFGRSLTSVFGRSLTFLFGFLRHQCFEGPLQIFSARLKLNTLRSCTPISNFGRNTVYLFANGFIEQAEVIHFSSRNWSVVTVAMHWITMGKSLHISNNQQTDCNWRYTKTIFRHCTVSECDHEVFRAEILYATFPTEYGRLHIWQIWSCILSEWLIQ